MHQNFPELVGKVTGDNLPPPPLVELLLKLLNGFQLAGLVVVVLGRNAFSLLGLQVPSWYSSIEKNGVQLAILFYLLLPQVLSKYLVTGAFEIELDGESIFSKIQTGRLPQFADLVEPLVSAGLEIVAKQEA
jgi:selT/selW/selH-like putative selenoprotein